MVMDSSQLGIPSELGSSLLLTATSGLDTSLNTPSITLERTGPLNVSEPVGQNIPAFTASKNTSNSSNTLDNTLSGVLDIPARPAFTLKTSMNSPLLRTGLGIHDSSTLNLSTNISFNTSYIQRKADSIPFLSNNPKHTLEEIVQEKHKKELSDPIHVKKINISTSNLKGNTHDYASEMSKYSEVNGNEDSLSHDNKKDIPLKFPGIAIPNLPFATIMDVQTDQPLLEKTPLQDKPNVVKKNETPLPKNQFRPKDPEDILRYELRKCFSVYAVTGDTRSCVRTVYDLMKDIVEDKAKIIMLETLKGGIKDDIIAAFIENKQVLGRIRNWLVNAINEKKNTVIIAILKIMSILKLDASTLAELKMGKPIMILSKKSEDETVKQLCMKWVEVAEKSLSLEKPTENSSSLNIPPVSSNDDGLKKKQKINTSDSTQKLPTAPKLSSIKPVVKSQKVQAVVNTDFFKNLSTPTTKASSQKPSLSSVLAQIKAPKKQNTTQPQVIETATSVSKKFTSVLEEVPGYQTMTPETTAMEINVVPDEAPKKKRKCVSWKSDDDLVEIRIFESIDPEETDNSFVHISRDFRNARDLDIYEGRAAFSKTHNMEDDMMTWREPEDIDFSHLESELPKLGPKRGGISKCNSDEYKIQEERERFVFLVSYLYEKDIPHSPTEPNTDSDGPFVETKIIPLPNDMKDSNTTDYLFQPNQGSINHSAFSNTLNQNNIPLSNPSLINNSQASISSILQNLLNASGQAVINTPSIPSVPQTMQHVPLPSSTFPFVNIANINNILQILQQTQKKPLQPSFPIPTVSSTASPFNFDALLGGQQKNHNYTDWNERNDVPRSRDKRHRSQRHRRR